MTETAALRGPVGEHNRDEQMKGATIVAVESDITIELNTAQEAQATATVAVDDESFLGGEEIAAPDRDLSENPGDSAEPAQLVDEKRTPRRIKRRVSRSSVLAFGVLPALALLLTLAAAFLKWQDSSTREADIARIESVRTARDSTIAMLSYRPDTVDQQLGAARNLLTGSFSDSYNALVHDVVIPGSKQKQISAVATVPAVASVSASPNHAVALVFVNQTVIVGNSAPTDTASTVRVTLDKLGNRWLISAFDPV